MRLILASALAILVGSGAASAQTIVPKQVQLGNLGTCLVRQAPKAATKLMATPLASGAEREAAEALVRGHDACIQGRVVSGRAGAIRGAVAQALFDAQSALDEKLAALADAPAVRPESGSGRAFMMAYGACLVHAKPGATAGLLRTAYETPEERTAFLAYGDALKACMPGKMQYHIDLPDLRNQIAAIAYQQVAGPAGTN